MHGPHQYATACAGAATSMPHSLQTSSQRSACSVINGLHTWAQASEGQPGPSRKHPSHHHQPCRAANCRSVLTAEAAVHTACCTQNELCSQLQT